MSDINDWNATIIEEFRSTGGEMRGQFQGMPMLLLHTTGARSGAERVSPMMYLDLDGHRYVFASKAGAPTNPDWFHNLVKNPAVTVEAPGTTYAATATVLEEPERARVYAVQAERFGQFAEYQSKTDRPIPVVELVAS